MSDPNHGRSSSTVSTVLLCVFWSVCVINTSDLTDLTLNTQSQLEIGVPCVADDPPVTKACL